MTRKKKKPAPVKETLAPGIEWIPVGKGFTRGSRVSVQMDIATADHAKRVLRIKMAEVEKSFEQEIARHEQEAIKTLVLAKLPANFGDSRTLPKEWDVSSTNTLDGRIKKVMFALSRMHPELGGMGLTEFVTSRGYRELEDPEWYAAAIIEAISITRAAIRRQDMDFALSQAYKIGRLVTEAKAHGFFKQSGAEGPPKRKQQKSPWPALADYLLRNYPDETVEEHFKMIPTISDDELTIKERYKFSRHKKRIYAEVRVRGEWVSFGKPLGMAGLRSRITEARKRKDR